MKARFIVLLAVVLISAALIALPVLARPAPQPAIQQADSPSAPEVYASPINAGCYIVAPNDCRIHVDPFTISLMAGSTLKNFSLQANGVEIYQFKTDASNPPNGGGTGKYTPSLVTQDFAAACGKTYDLFLIGQDSLDPSPLSMGAALNITCPSSVP